MKLKYRIKEWQLPFAETYFTAQYKIFGLWLNIDNNQIGRFTIPSAVICETINEAKNRIDLHIKNMNRAKDWLDRSSKVVSFGNNEQEIFTGLIDSGSNNSFVDVYLAEKINGVIIDTITTSGINSNIERKPVIQIKLSVDSMEGNWIELKVGVMDTHHPNHQIILGRDFMEIFKKITFDFENKKTILDY